jgi:hypothetical protein
MRSRQSDPPNRRTADCARVPKRLDQIDGSLASVAAEWFASSGYSRRSLVENAVFRYRAILGHRMRRRSLGSQRIEVDLARKILNTTTSLGMPDSVRVR